MIIATKIIVLLCLVLAIYGMVRVVNREIAFAKPRDYVATFLALMVTWAVLCAASVGALWAVYLVVCY